MLAVAVHLARGGVEGAVGGVAVALAPPSDGQVGDADPPAQVAAAPLLQRRLGRQPAVGGGAQHDVVLRIVLVALAPVILVVAVVLILVVLC